MVQREVLDPYAYVEIWLADAGLTGSPEYADAVRRLVDYFDRLGIEAVGLGWLTLRRTGAYARRSGSRTGRTRSSSRSPRRWPPD